MTLSPERNTCRLVMQNSLTLESFVGERLELMLDWLLIDDLTTAAEVWELCKRAYIQGLKDGYLTTLGKTEKAVIRDREDNALEVLYRQLRRAANPDYVSQEALEQASDYIRRAYVQGVKEGQIPFGGLAI